MQTFQKIKDPFNAVAESIVIFLLFFSPLINGGIGFYPLAIIQCVCFFLCGLMLVKIMSRDSVSFVKFSVLPMILFILLVLLQLIDLTPQQLRNISPQTSLLYSTLAPHKESLTLSIYPEDTIAMLLQLFAYLCIFLTILNYVDTQQKAKRIVNAIIVCGVLYSLYAIFRGLPTKSLRYSTFTNANHFAAYIEIIMPLTISCVFITKNNLIRLFLFFAVITQLIALFLSLSRAGIVFGCTGIMFFFTLIGIKRGAHKTVGIAAVLVVTISLMLAIIGTSPIAKELNTLFNINKAYSSRLATLHDSINIIKDFPFFGVGLNCFQHIIQKYNTLGFYTIGFSHNEPVQLLAETGAVGFLLLLLFLFLHIRSCYINWSARQDPRAIYIGAACLAGIFAVLLHSCFEFLLHVPANILLFFIILALMYKVCLLRHNAEPPIFTLLRPRYIKSSIVVATLLLLSFFTFLTLQRFFAEIFYTRAQKERKIILETNLFSPYRDNLDDIRKARHLNPLNAQYLIREAEIIFAIARNHNIEINPITFPRLDSRPHALSLVEKNLNHAITINPTQAKAHFALGDYYQNTGSISAAQIYYRQAYLLDPQNKKIKNAFEKLFKTDR